MVAVKTREVVALGVLGVLAALLALLLTLAPTYTKQFGADQVGGR